MISNDLKYIILIYIIGNVLINYSYTKTVNEFQKMQDTIKISKYFDSNIIENRKHRVGLLNMTFTNCGQFGRSKPYMNLGEVSTGLHPGLIDECTGKQSRGAEMPAGSNIEYLWSTGLWAGGYIDSSATSIGGTSAEVFQGPLVSTSYDCANAYSYEFTPTELEEDPTGIILGRIRETSNIEGRINCLFEDVYDPKSTAYEQFSTMYSDKSTKQYTWDAYELRSHIPLGIEVKQVSYSWPYEYAQKFIIVDYTFYNRNKEKKDIFDLFLGQAVDFDINNQNVNKINHKDDICGFINKWLGYIDPATGENNTVDLNMVWAADNDGREYLQFGNSSDMTELGQGNLLNGATGVFTARILRNPNPNLKYSFNIWAVNDTNGKDWSPHWKSGCHYDWQYDLTLKQKGYDDLNYDSLQFWDGSPLFGGRTEGLPYGDKGRYMVMSNDEFDYDLTAIREVYLGMDHQINGAPIQQADKWQPWIVTGTEGTGKEPDGTIKEMNDFTNGLDGVFLIGFGPLGNETYVNVAVDTDHDSLGVPDDYINKKVWKFAYGDSLKLTLAFMVSENFHTSLEQDPNYRDSTVVDLSDGLDVSLFDQGWYDAFNNVVWAERVFDTPMYDTPVRRWGTSKKDGWFGEDVGADAMFGDIVSDTYCWWLNSAYPGPDEGEGDFEMTTFTTPVSDCYGNTASNEDDLLIYGRQHANGHYGITGDLDDGEGYGYMIKYDKLDGTVPQGTWVRYGYDNGKLDAGDGVPDFTSPPPPPSPKIKVTELDNEVIVEWSSHEFYTGEDGSVGVAGPEFTYDPYTRLYDFEGYNIEISPDRQLNNFTTIVSVDKMNYSYQNVADVKDYLDNPIPADTLAAHSEDYPAMRTVNGKIYQLVPYGDNRDLAQDHIKPDLFSYTCTIDTSRIAEWGEIRYYRFVLYNQLLADKKYIAVTAKDFGAPKMGVPAIKSSPESNATASVTATLSKTDEIIVVPNPYRGDVKYTDMGWEDLDGSYTYAEEYRKIAFLNIPERCVIRIYTLAGDLCKVITHNGNSDPDVPYWYGRNGAYWNLINDNRQACLSGLYLFSVQDVDKKKDDFVGKFVIIK